MVRPTQKVVYLRACSRIRAKDAEEARARAIGLGNVANETYHLGNVVCSAVCNEGGSNRGTTETTQLRQAICITQLWSFLQMFVVGEELSRDATKVEWRSWLVRGLASNPASHPA
jgi:hypothetical protein